MPASTGTVTLVPLSIYATAGTGTGAAIAGVYAGTVGYTAAGFSGYDIYIGEGTVWSYVEIITALPGAVMGTVKLGKMAAHWGKQGAGWAKPVTGWGKSAVTNSLFRSSRGGAVGKTYFDNTFIHLSQNEYGRPFFRQAFDDTCGQACVNQLISDAGIGRPAAHMGIAHFGKTSAGELSHALSRAGLASSYSKGLFLNQLLPYVGNGKPVICNCTHKYRFQHKTLGDY